MIRSRSGIYAQQSVEAFQGLFNLYPNNWAAGYSVRLLDAANVDTAKFTIRRSSDSAEEDFMVQSLANPWIDLNARMVGMPSTTLGDFVGAGGDGYVRQWWNESSANHATQTTAANQPMLVNAGSLVTENGKTALQFSGAQYLQGSFPDLDNEFYANTVGRIVTDGSETIWEITNGSAILTGIALYTSSSQFRLLINDGANVVASTSLIDDTQLLFTHRYNSGSSSQFINGSTSGTASPNDLANTLNTITIGAFWNGTSVYEMNGTIQEAVFSSVDRPSDQTGIESNINSAFSIY